MDDDDFSDLDIGADYPGDEPDPEHPEEAVEPAGEESQAPARRFPTVVEFVEQFLVFAINQKMSPTSGQGLRWDPNWHQYPMVVYRLIALHEAYEEAYVTGGSAMSSWWIQHFDPHMRVILDGDKGPFHAYDEGSISMPPKPLKVTPATSSPLLFPPGSN